LRKNNLTFKGTNFIYNGEELGMVDLTEQELPDECKVDIQKDSRDFERNPIPWNGDLGFFIYKKFVQVQF